MNKVKRLSEIKPKKILSVSYNLYQRKRCKNMYVFAIISVRSEASKRASYKVTKTQL